MTYSYTITQDLDWQQRASWQMPDTPFISFRFLQALIDSGAIGEGTGWMPLYVIVEQTIEQTIELNKTDDADSQPIAVMPVFVKNHHQGEYVFDHAWAEAYARYGVDYYPRLVTSVPFTPITGQRLWLADGIMLDLEILQTAMQAVDDIASQINASSWHGLFVDNTMADIVPDNKIIGDTLALNPLQLLKREGNQFLWQNQNLKNQNPNSADDINSADNNADSTDNTKPFTNFDEFLATLTAKKRKNIRAERKKVAKQNLTCQIKTGDEIDAHDWKIFYQCYAMTYAIRGRHPYLNEAFFAQLATTMPEHLMLAQAIDEAGAVVASSLFLYDTPDIPNATLYGRYWGSLAEYDSLHFELCYYQGIEFAIKQRLQYFDPGTQGEHKLVRGFVPTKTHSLHRIYDKRFVPAIADFCRQDREYMVRYRQQAHEALPFNIDNMPAFKG